MISDVQRPNAETLDPSHRLYWKRDVQRLDAESFRDALLAVSGRLNENRHQGPPIKVTSQDPSLENLLNNRRAYESFPNRTVYLPVVRSHLYDLLTLLDFPNATTPVGERSQTTVPTQALLLFNSHFVMDMSGQISDRVVEHESETKERLIWLYHLLFARSVSDEEIGECVEFLKHCSSISSEDDCWKALCHSLVMSNEFTHVW
ncbi:MAG: DUF1553 domain-containing protein [Verrucomicrobia bacterium]|jgi:hypothetical protein|nr:DUF1553 domain-containing protein [Verrucomicrobiota bacterium]